MELEPTPNIFPQTNRPGLSEPIGYGHGKPPTFDERMRIIHLSNAVTKQAKPVITILLCNGQVIARVGGLTPTPVGWRQPGHEEVFHRPGARRGPGPLDRGDPWRPFKDPRATSTGHLTTLTCPVSRREPYGGSLAPNRTTTAVATSIEGNPRSLGRGDQT